MASNTVVFQQCVSKFGRIEYRTSIGRDRMLTFKKSNVKLNIGLDELDELFSLRGQLESLTAYFEKPYVQESVSVQQSQSTMTIVQAKAPTTSYDLNDKENIPPPPPTTPSPLTMQGQVIPVITAKRACQSTYIPAPEKRQRYEVVTPPATDSIYHFTDEELQTFFEPTWSM